MATNIRKLEAGSGGRKTDKWIVAYYDANHKRRHKQFDSETEAGDFQASVRVEVKQGKHVPDSESLTVSKARDEWLKDNKASWEKATYADYERTMKLHVVPFIGAKKLTQLSNQDISALVKKLEDGGRSTFTVKRTLVTLRSMLTWCVTEEHVGRNVVAQTSKSTSKKLAGKARMQREQEDPTAPLFAGVDFPKPDEIKALSDWLKAPLAPVGVKYASLTVAGVVRWRPMILLIINTGLRISEALGLRWQDCELTGKNLQIHVRQKIDRYGNPGAVKTSTGSYRTIPISPALAQMLLGWKDQCPKRQFEEYARPIPKDKDGKRVFEPKRIHKPVLDLVFPTSTGEANSTQNFVQRGLEPAWKLAGVVNADGEAKYTGAHCLRHFYASWLINPKENGGRGMEPFAAIKRLGHSDVAMLTKVYGHAFGQTEASRKEEEAAAERLFG